MWIKNASIPRIGVDGPRIRAIVNYRKRREQMTSTFQPTKDDLSRGKAFWNAQVQAMQYRYSRTVGDTNLQKVLNLETMCREIAAKCQTYGPCSRECVGGGA
jgi:hypothetical protein